MCYQFSKIRFSDKTPIQHKYGIMEELRITYFKEGFPAIFSSQLFTIYPSSLKKVE